MKKKVIAAAAFAIMICVVFSSCGMGSMVRTVDSLLTPPLYYSEYEELVEAFNEAVDKSVVLCNPTEGDHLSAITVSDIDSDGVEEGIVFYRDTLEDDVACFSVFKNIQGEWIDCGDYVGYGNRVTSLVFADLDSDSSSEIMVIWNYSGITGGKVFSVYRSKPGNVKYGEIAKESCDLAKAVDLDGDGYEEIFFVSTLTEKTKVTKKAKLMKYYEKELSVISEAPVDSNVGNYVSYKYESVDPENAKIYLDANKGSDMMITEIIGWDRENGQLTSPLYDEETGSNIASLRYEQIECADVNGDGKYEIPVQTIYSGSDENPVYLTDWTYFDGSEPVYHKESFVNVSDGYYVDLTALPKANLNVRKQSAEDWSGWVIYSEDSEKIIGNTVLILTECTRKRWESGLYDSHIIIFKQLDYVLCARINTLGEEMGIDEDTVRRAVVKLA